MSFDWDPKQEAAFQRDLYLAKLERRKRGVGTPLFNYADYSSDYSYWFANLSSRREGDSSADPEPSPAGREKSRRDQKVPRTLSQKNDAKRRLEKESIKIFYRRAWKRAEFYRAAHVTTDYSGSCLFPVVVHTPPLLARCRWCMKCEQASAYHWEIRSRNEFARGFRNVFFTGTWSKTHREMMRSRAPTEAELGALAYSAVTPFHKFAEIWLGQTIRYLYVLERHKDGFPHVHGLLHMTEYAPVRWLNGLWPFGHSRVRLANAKDAAYVCKYVNKSRNASTRLRCSQSYGKLREAVYNGDLEAPKQSPH